MASLVLRQEAIARRSEFEPRRVAHEFAALSCPVPTMPPNVSSARLNGACRISGTTSRLSSGPLCVRRSPRPGPTTAGRSAHRARRDGATVATACAPDVRSNMSSSWLTSSDGGMPTAPSVVRRSDGRRPNDDAGVALLALAGRLRRPERSDVLRQRRRGEGPVRHVPCGHPVRPSGNAPARAARRLGWLHECRARGARARREAAGIVNIPVAYRRRLPSSLIPPARGMRAALTSARNERGAQITSAAAPSRRGRLDTPRVEEPFAGALAPSRGPRSARPELSIHVGGGSACFPVGSRSIFEDPREMVA